MVKNIFNLLIRSKNLHPDKIFLRDLDKNFFFNFKDTVDFILKFNNFLHSKGLKKQSKIVVIFENSILMSLLFLGITSTNRVFVPVNPDIGILEFSKILKSSGAKYFIIDEKFKNKFKIFFKNRYVSIDNQKKFIKKIIKEKPLKFDRKFLGLSQILYTSGSTGNPKGVMLTHSSMMANLDGIEKSLNLKRFKNFMAITPLFHNGGQFIPTLLAIKTFGTSLPVPSKTSISIFWEIVNEYCINYTLVMPTHLAYLLQLKKSSKKNQLLGICCGGAKLDLKIQNKFEKKFSVKIAHNYGLTEASSSVSSENFKQKKNLGSVGKPFFNNSVKIVNKNKYKNGLGEIIVRGKNIFNGYINNKKKTNEIIKKNWLYTGDLGCFDKKGNLYILDRKDSMVVVSGENIFPNEIEQFSNLYNKIKLSAVIPVKDAITQNKLILIYESKYKIKKENIMEFLYNKISSYKIPKIIINCREIGLKEIPKASNGKILRKKLKNHIDDYFLSTKKNV